MLKALGRWWRNRQRKLDMKILWPICKDKAPDIDYAKACFAVHAFNDPAWTKDYNHEEIKTFITNLV